MTNESRAAAPLTRRTLLAAGGASSVAVVALVAGQAQTQQQAPKIIPDTGGERNTSDQTKAKQEGELKMIKPDSSEEIRKADAQSEEEWYYSVGVQNYVFALPLHHAGAGAKDKAKSRRAGKSKEVCAGRAHQSNRPHEDACDGRRRNALHA